MKTIRLILGDQLCESISSLKGYAPNSDLVVLCEVWREATYVKHHKKKIAFLFSAMRHFAEQLRHQSFRLEYVTLGSGDQPSSLRQEIKRLCEQHQAHKVIVTHPGEYRVLMDLQSWEREIGIGVEIRDDDRFLCGLDEFAHWAKDRKQLRMEHFYRHMRTKHNILMQGDRPEGGAWNYDADNRKSPQADLDIPPPYVSQPDAITREVLALVADRFDDHFGDLEPFHFAVTRAQALQVLRQFIDQRLSRFGDYQDAMIQGEPWMYHAHISFYLNCGLLNPLECVQAAEQAYRQGRAPLNAAEGFIRQIIGWREYVRGIYWLNMPDYAEVNYFSATRPLPDFYWTANTQMNCLRQCVLETKRNAYAHHIQRLMVLGNFALLAGLDPKQVNAWFLIVYADAYEWVELPNVSGMILFADGGYLASKPYAAGGNYINTMSNYCKSCRYSVTKKNGPKACPFNYLYWDFLDRNRDQLSGNHRLGMMYKSFDRMSEEKQQAIRLDSALFLKTLT